MMMRIEDERNAGCHTYGQEIDWREGPIVILERKTNSCSRGQALDTTDEAMRSVLDAALRTAAVQADNIGADDLSNLRLPFQFFNGAFDDFRTNGVQYHELIRVEAQSNVGPGGDVSCSLESTANHIAVR